MNCPVDIKEFSRSDLFMSQLRRKRPQHLCFGNRRPVVEVVVVLRLVRRGLYFMVALKHVKQLTLRRLARQMGKLLVRDGSVAVLIEDLASAGTDRGIERSSKVEATLGMQYESV